MTDLWDSDETPSDISNVDPSQALVQQETPAIVCFFNQQRITSETEFLFKSMAFCETIVLAAHAIADHVPILATVEAQEFWKEKMIPLLGNVLQQDIQARSVVSQSFSSIRTLAICIKQGAELVQAAKGSRASIDAARQTIKNAFDGLKTSADKATSLASDAMKNFSENIGKLLSVMGAETVQYYESKAEIANKIQEQYEKQEKLISEMADLKGELEVYHNLIHVTESKIKGTEAALDGTKRRSAELHSLDSEMERRIQNISATIDNTDSNIFSRASNRRCQVPNPNRQVQKDYYESIVKSRTARIEASQREEERKQAALDELNRCLAEYNGKYTAGRFKLDQLEKSFPEKLLTIENEIASLKQKLQDIETNAAVATRTMGTHGTHLVQLIGNVKILRENMNKGVNMYDPLLDLLKAVQASVEVSIGMFCEGEAIDIYEGGKSLLMQVNWLLSYHGAASKQIEASSQYLALPTVSNMRAIQIS